jgi:uncharacterized SAM-binding protein YcdF (DUF218 family)
VFYYVSKIAWFFATPSNLLPALALVGLLVALHGRARRLGIGLALAATVLTFAAGLSPVANWLILPLEERFPAYRDDGAPIAGVIVLGGAVQGDVSEGRGTLQLNEAAERVVALADLARRHPQARIVFTGGGAALIQDEPAESDIVARFASTLGVARERIEFENASRTTAENASLTRRLVEPKPGERWLLVTSAWHMPRSVGTFRQAGFTVTAYPVDYRTSGPGDRWRVFAAASEGLRRLDLVAKEWAGLVGYRLAGRTDALFPAP